MPGADNIKLSGDFLTHVFEGPFSQLSAWCKQMEEEVTGDGKRLDILYYFCTTCPKCAKHFGKNYVVAIVQVKRDDHASASTRTVRSSPQVAEVRAAIEPDWVVRFGSQATTRRATRRAPATAFRREDC